MTTCIELTYGIDSDGPYIDYLAHPLDLSEQLIDGDRMPGCYVDRTIDNFIIAKGNVLEHITAEF